MKTITKLLSCFVLFVIAVPSLSQAGEYDGTYGGFQLGYGGLSRDTGTVSTKFSSLVGGIFLGYRTPVTDQLLIGGEIDLSYYTNGSDTNFGVYGIAGFQAGSNGLAYFRLGYATLDQGDLPSLKGMVYGVGYEFEVTNTLDVRLDYRYKDYNDTTVNNVTRKNSGNEVMLGLVYEF